jgi:hypothetical protein
MFNSLWSNGLNTDMVAMYPFIGGTAASHAIQAMNPGTYNILFNGGWTHNTSGATPNGTTGYGLLNGLVPAVRGFTVSGGSVGVYCGTDGSGGAAIGCVDGGGLLGGALTLYPALLNPTKQMATNFWNKTAAYSITTIPDTLGLMSIARSGSTSNVQFYRRGNLVSSENQTALAVSIITVNIGANNSNGTINSYSTYRQQFTYLYKGTLTTSQMTILDNIIQTYQTDLGRNVY